MGDVRAAREREGAWLARTTGATASDSVPGSESAESSDVAIRLAYWAQRARFLEHLFREALAQAEALHAQCRASGIDEAEIRRQAGSLPVWGHMPTSGPGKVSSASARTAGGFAVAGFYAESGPDLDGDGDVDGGLMDRLDQFFDG